ncbi:MAG: hypothetical protein WA760_01375, partial [Pseudolabrys sp.]
LRLQQKIIDAVTPFTVKTGTPAAFMSTENGRDIQKFLIIYVANFVKIGSGKKFVSRLEPSASRSAERPLP